MPFSNNNNVSSYASSSDHDSLTLRHFLKNNLENMLISSFEDFLQDVFEFKPNNNINLEKICRDDTTCSLFRTFLSSLTKPECDRFEPFTNLANHMSSLIAVEMHRECSIFARPHDTVAVRNSSSTTRYPDVVFASKSQNLEDNPLDWSDVKLVLEFKAKVSTSDNAPKKSPRTRASKISSAALQLAAYALESFIHGPYRSHVVHGTIQESTLELWYYDRVGAVRSSGVDFSGNLVLLAQFLMAISHLSEASWGLHPRITYPQLTPLSRSLCPHFKLPTPDDEGSSLDIKSNGSVHDSSYQLTPESRPSPAHPFNGATITVQNRTFVLGDYVSRQYSLVGRGTCVIEADGGTVVVKLSWPEKTRTPEYEFLERAYTSAMEYDNGKYAGMKNHLPVLEAKEDFGEWGPRSRILARKSTSASSGAGSRILRVTVYQKLLPMTEIRTADDLMSVMRDIALCYRWLYRVMGILHGDINMNNIMIRRDGVKVVGVLIDYDLAIDINKPSSTSLERIGVRRFMAIDLMKGSLIPHHARHDMEAMYWVLVWFTFRYEDGEEIRATRRPLEKWVTSPNDMKSSFLREIEGRPTPPFSSLYKSWILPWNRLFCRGHNELGDYNNECSHDPRKKTKELSDEIVFPSDAVFFHDTSMWIAFWNVLSPDKHFDFDDVSSSARWGFLPHQGHSSL